MLILVKVRYVTASQVNLNGVVFNWKQSQLYLYIFISVINQLDAQNFCFYNKFISCLYMFRAHVLIIRRSKLYYTASGIITPIRGRLVHETSFNKSL